MAIRFANILNVNFWGVEHIYLATQLWLHHFQLVLQSAQVNQAIINDSATV